MGIFLGLMSFIKKIRLSTIAIFIALIAAVLIDLSLKNWEKNEKVIEWDVHNYYAYLPLQFIYGDIEIEDVESYRYGDNLYHIWIEKTKDGRNVIKGPIGMVYMYGPFFFIGHLVALLTDNYPADGFSAPYKMFLLLGALLYFVVGLFFVKKILEYYNFADKHISIVLFLLGIGTNLLAYSSSFAPMPHVFNFALMAIFIYYSILWHSNQKFKYLVVLGLLLGIITQIRPTNILIVIFFLFYGINDIQSLTSKVKMFKNEFIRLSIFIPLGLLIWIPQFLYWKMATGNYIYYSFGDEGFFFTDPKIIEGLFSFRKGWLIYTPVMIFSLIGMFLLKNEVKKLKFVIISFFVINIYIIFSWWCWWYGGTFGQRSMIDSYSLLAIPLAAFVQFLDKQITVKYIVYAVFLFFIWLNIFQTYQFEHKSLHYDSMSKELYFKQFGKLQPVNNFDDYLDWADYDAAKYRKGVTQESEGEYSIPRKVNILASNGKYLCAELDKNVMASRDVADEWELFIIEEGKNDEISIIAYSNYYFSADLGSKGELTASRTDKNSWEIFKLIPIEGDYCAIQTSNGKFLSVNIETQKITASALSISENEKFKLIYKR